MSVISLTIEESSEELVAGIPAYVSVSANLPSIIFYTLDGTEPTTSSSVYSGPILMPTVNNSVTFKVFATNGVDYSSVITNKYTTSIISNTRLPLSPSLRQGSGSLSEYPYGSNDIYPGSNYDNNANNGNTALSPGVVPVQIGWDADGEVTGLNKPLDDYLNIYSTLDSSGRYFPNVGTIPNITEVIGKRTPEEYNVKQSSMDSPLFNPRAMVIFQDSTTEDPSNPPFINRQYFSLENPEISRDGGILYASGLDTPTVTGSFLRSHYNPRTGNITYYYRDSATNKWIISTTPYEPRISNPGELYGMVFGRGGDYQTNGFVFKWIPFIYRVLT